MTKVIPVILIGLFVFGALSQNIILRNPGCNAYDERGVCKACSSRFYRDQNNICQPVNPNCRTYDQTNGDCLSCYPGFGLLQGTCLPGIEDQTSLDPNCNQFNDNVCVKCSFGYYFDQDGKCSKADPNCLTFNERNGDCLSCYPSFALQSGKCVREAAKPIDPNCNQFDSNNNCIRCSSGYFFSAGVCTKIDDSCKAYDIESNTCKECYAGYVLDIESKCIRQAPKQNPNPLCAEWNGSICTKCAKGSVFDKSGMCFLQDAYCRTYDGLTNQCKRCYTGYALQNGVCQLEKQKQVSDPNCNSFGSNGVCSRCSIGFYLNEAKICTKIDDSCKSFSVANRRCMSCYSGYQLSSSGECVRVIQEVTDVNCAQWNGTICQKCSVGARFDSSGLCVIIDAQCKQFDENTNKCKSCYAGYQIESDSNTCVQSAVGSVADPNCAEWNGNVCLKCSFGAAFNNLGKCIVLDSQCKQYDQLSGLCKSCYSGYELNNLNVCIQSSPEQLSDLLCAQWSNSVCVKCSPGSFFGQTGKCTQIDTSCRAANSLTGECLDCYPGYKLNADGQCVKHEQELSDLNCAEWNGDICIKCSLGSTFDNFGKCVFLDSQCRQYDQAAGHCKACYSGYTLDSSFVCVKSQLSDVTDSLCAEWNQDICMKCSFGSFFNSNGVCTQADSSCKTFDQISGKCLSCFNGYSLSEDGFCTKTADKQNNNPQCAEWDQNGELCLRCVVGSFFNGLGVCELVNPLCKTFDALNGACTSCFSGYEVTGGGQCEKSKEEERDAYCAEFQEGFCVKCSNGYYFERDGKCTAADPLCATFDPMDGRCLTCFLGYEVQSGLCILKEEDARDPNCASFNPDNTCKQCSKGFVFNQDTKNCQLTNPLCKTIDQNGACTSCYGGYVIKGTTCQLDENAESSFCAELVDNICIRCASRTFLNSNGQCEKVSEDCRTYNDFDGNCLSCYSGFALKNGTCMRDLDKGGCAQYDSDGKCVKCSSGYYLNSGECTQVDAQCAKFNFDSNVCEGCYSGYTLLQGRCEIQKVDEEYEVKNCIAYNTEKKCIQCFDRFYLTNNQCKEVSVFCKTYDLISGACTGCYSNFKLRNGQCSK